MGNFMKNRTSTPRLSHHDEQKADKSRLLPIVKEAGRLNVWLYNKYNGNWYTPEEFSAKYRNTELNNYEMARMLENIIIRDPRAGNAAYHKTIVEKRMQYEKEMAELMEKGEAFINKVIDYYQRK